MAVLSPVLGTLASGSVVSVDVTSKGCFLLLCGCTSPSMETRKQIEDQARPLAAWAGGGSLSGHGHPCHLGALCTWPGPFVWGTVRQGRALWGRADLWLRSLWVRGGWDGGLRHGGGGGPAAKLPAHVRMRSSESTSVCGLDKDSSLSGLSLVDSGHTACSKGQRTRKHAVRGARTPAAVSRASRCGQEAAWLWNVYHHDGR